MLDVFDHIPDGLLKLESNQLFQLLKRPTLIHLEGDRQPPLFVSILLHGNETTSWLAMRELLRKYYTLSSKKLSSKKKAAAIAFIIYRQYRGCQISAKTFSRSARLQSHLANRGLARANHGTTSNYRNAIAWDICKY